MKHLLGAFPHNRAGVVTETIYGQVVSKANNYQVGNDGRGKRRIVKTERLKAYEREFARQCKLYRDKNINGRFTLFVVVYESSFRYDLDNALKTILDCLQYVHAIKDDNLCAMIVAKKVLDRSCPRVVFAIVEHEPKLEFGL